MLDVVSPELALVDPELAARARALLPASVDEQVADVAHVVTPPRLAVAEEPVLSPELALVDPELAAWARARLPEPPYLAFLDRGAPRTTTAEPAAVDLVQRRAARRPMRTVKLAVAALVLAAAGLLAGNASHELGRTEPAAFNLAVETAAQALQTTASVSHPAARARAQTKPKHSATSVPQRRSFAWAHVGTASWYEIAFYRGRRRIFGARTTGQKLTVGRSWTYQGRREGFTPGLYRWYVWPIHKSAKGVLYGEPLVSSKLTVSG